MLLSSSLRRLALRRGVLPQVRGAAATSKQKRALAPEQIQGANTNTSSSHIPTNEPPPSSTNGGSSSSMLPLGVAGAVAVAGGAYYVMGRGDSSSLAATADAPVTEVVKRVEEEAKLVSPKAKTASSETQKSSSEGNRVSSISMPAKMKNTKDPASPPVPVNPVDGNRVSSLVSTKSPPITDTSMTQDAIKELSPAAPKPETQQALLESHQSLWNTLSDTYFTDLESLSTAQLKARVIQLATEMKDNTKWEAVRLKEFLTMKEKETAEQYMNLMQQQRNEFENILAKRLREQEHELQMLANKAIQEKELSIQNLLNTALEALKKEHDEDLKAFEELKTLEISNKIQEEFDSKLEAYKNQVAQEMQQKVSALQKLSNKLKELENALKASGSYREGSVKAHRLSAAALSLSEKLETDQPAGPELTALKTVAGDEGVIATAIRTIPAAVSQIGIPTLPSLQTTFETVYKKSRQAAMVPAGRLGVEGQLAGMLFATLKYPPNPDDAAPESEKDNAEYVLARAKKHVSMGELEQAVEQLDKLSGQTAFTVTDWKRQAMDRIAVDKALKVIKMECALLNESMAE